MPIPSIIDNQLRRFARDNDAYHKLRVLFEQQQAQTDLQTGETLHETVVREAPIAIYVYDIDLDRVIFGNPAYEAQLGYSMDRVQVMGKDLVHSIYHADDMALRRETDEMLLADRQGQVFINIFRVIRSDGDLRWVAAREMVLARHDDGRPRQIISIGQDITEFQAASDALAASKEAMNRLIQQLPVGIQVFDVDGTCIDVNASHLEIFGVRRADLVGKYNIFADRWAEQMVTREAALRAIQGETVSMGDLMFDFAESDPRYARTDKGQRTINVTIMPILDERGKVTSFMGVNLDITERKRVEDELREQQRQYRDLADSITDVFYALDYDLRYTFWNRASEQLTGIAAADALGKTLYELFPKLKGGVYDRVFQEVLRTRETRSIEFPYTLDDGRERHFDTVIYPAPDGVNVLVRDVTERVRTQQRDLELQLQRDRQKLLANFVEKVAHEFRTPLSTIGTSVYLMTRTTDKEKLKSRVDQINRQIARIANLVDMQLLLVKLDSNIPLKMMAVDLNQLCETMLVRYPGPPTVGYTRVAGLPTVHGNMDILETAITQLLDNARRHTPVQGSITIGTGYDTEQVWVEVADTGVGIEEAHHEDIFKAFWRADTAHTHPGFGLGLPIVKRVVEAHGGHVEVESRVDEGSRFRLTLPRQS